MFNFMNRHPERTQNNQRVDGSCRLHAGRGPKGYNRPDEMIYEEACEILSRRDDIDATDIEIEVKDQKIRLHGRVPTKKMRRLAEDSVEGIRGVKDVQNDVKVVSPTDQHLQTTLTTGVY